MRVSRSIKVFEVTESAILEIARSASLEMVDHCLGCRLLFFRSEVQKQACPRCGSSEVCIGGIDE